LLGYSATHLSNQATKETSNHDSRSKKHPKVIHRRQGIDPRPARHRLRRRAGRDRLVGRSVGSGKTTFLSILGCILTPSKGDVVIDGEQAGAKQLNSIRKRSLGFVFQQFNLFPALTAIENIEYALNVKGMRGREARTRRLV